MLESFRAKVQGVALGEGKDNYDGSYKMIQKEKKAPFL